MTRLVLTLLTGAAMIGAACAGSRPVYHPYMIDRHDWQRGRTT
jgi:hypothetical protein